MGISRRIGIAIKAIRELGPQKMGQYALYQLQLRSGFLSRQLKNGRKFNELPPKCFELSPILPLPDPGKLMDILGDSGRSDLLNEADEIVAGIVRLFAGEPLPLDLGPAESELNWSELERRNNGGRQADIKWVWEAGRFGWAFILGRAYWISADERYPQAFWSYLEQFLGANPPYYGLHWISAQEAALRLISLAFAGCVFSDSPTSTAERKLSLGSTIAAHAIRIPPSLSYARAQDNNHLLVEGVGLYTAGISLEAHPQASRWRGMGWDLANQALMSQIAEDGTYVQHSTNYHRLMLQAALWLQRLGRFYGEELPQPSLKRLKLATHWLFELLDEETGGVPNLGPNDGAYILPLSVCPFRDYRPVLQTAACAFLGERVFAPGKWDEMALWLGEREGECGNESGVQHATQADNLPDSRKLLVLQSKNSWGYLRAARFSARPGHADQLHLDLWWRGVNVAMDAGSYLYNASPPWQNALSGTQVHNTVMVNDLDQMTPAGRFLWLDWAQASGITRERAAEGAWERAEAEHDGYRSLGVIHKRKVTAYADDRWLVEDALTAGSGHPEAHSTHFSIRLHWLLPDWSWELTQTDAKPRLLLLSQHGRLALQVGWQAGLAEGGQQSFQLARAGELLSGSGPVSPISGWFSPTYGYKYPALSFAVMVQSDLPVELTSEWQLSTYKSG